MAELAKKGGEIPGLEGGAKDKAERDALWTSEWADDLTVAIALREWEKAVTLVEEGKPLVALESPPPPLILVFRGQAKQNSQPFRS